MTKVALTKQTGFNQDFEFRCLGGKYLDLFFQSGFRDTAGFFKQKSIKNVFIIYTPKYDTPVIVNLCVKRGVKKYFSRQTKAV